ncbi:heterokaryon incompatibility protein-domain-containing protein [Cunninghamella echinulata]|nr:heterokaryon incompatibility protein-domain-containing protein [Cunninghamella echinulata]
MILETSFQKVINKIKWIKQVISKTYFPLEKKKSKLDPKIEIKTEHSKIEKDEKEDNYDLILIDIFNSFSDIICVKKNMYGDLKYIAISYRWGELREQQVQTPDYTAHITSFNITDLTTLLSFIRKEHDLKNIQYMWIDAISINQQNDVTKKETILKMTEIYQNATYILAVPDLHRTYLNKNPANLDSLNLIYQNGKTIYENILNNNSTAHGGIEENENLKKAYKFLEYLIIDWSNRAWVISEYHIASKKIGTPLKYIFISLLDGILGHEGFQSFFTYNFDQHFNTNVIEVNNVSSFMKNLNQIFLQRSYLEKIISSNATRNEDRFNAIFPSWKKYSSHIINRNTVSEWGITTMTSVILKLYEIMDLWDKAALLYACSTHLLLPISPTFGSQFNDDTLRLIEKDDFKLATKYYSQTLSNHLLNINGNNKKDEEYQKINEMEFGSIYTDNLLDIQYNNKSLLVKSNSYFTIKLGHSFDQEFLSLYLLENSDSLKSVFIPFFTFTIPKYTDVPPVDGSGIYLVGNIDKNRWIVIPKFRYCLVVYEYLLCKDNYTFKIY